MRSLHCLSCAICQIYNTYSFQSQFHYKILHCLTKFQILSCRTSILCNFTNTLVSIRCLVFLNDLTFKWAIFSLCKSLLLNVTEFVVDFTSMFIQFDILCPKVLCHKSEGLQKVNTAHDVPYPGTSASSRVHLCN